MSTKFCPNLLYTTYYRNHKAHLYHQPQQHYQEAAHQEVEGYGGHQYNLVFPYPYRPTSIPYQPTSIPYQPKYYPMPTYHATASPVYHQPSATFLQQMPTTYVLHATPPHTSHQQRAPRPPGLFHRGRGQ